MEFPVGLAWIGETEEGRAWLLAVPDLVRQCADLWRLRVEAPFPYAYTSVAFPAQRADGSAAVLKLQFPGRETEHEALALRRWNGDGAIQLLAEDASRHALLLERCIPGTPVPPDVGLAVIRDLLPRLWVPVQAPPFRALAEEAAHWASGLAARRRDRVVDAALDALRTLSSTQGEQVLLHQDLHGGNVLAAEREPYLVIDPKPLAGEREFGLAPIIRSPELGPGRRETIRRLDWLTSELGLDRERARLWCLAQTVAWSIGDGQIPEHVEVAAWLLDA